MEDDKTPFAQKIDIKGFATNHERDAVIAAIIAVALGAAAVGATYAVKKEPRLLTPWKMAAGSRFGQSYTDLRQRYKARKQQD